MRIIDLIEKKKQGFSHTKEELAFFINGVVRGEIPDYQISAWLMAVCFQGMNDRELADMTELMARSGDMTDLSSLGETTVDKHSTGGVGDKTTPIVAPLVAALGGTVAKMSGRGLGFTGGTVDKLESIPDFQTEIPMHDFFAIVKKHGVCVVGQSGNLTPADKKLYALRDVTATVNSIPLIASSIMSKKLAAGAKSIVLDVKVGGGAFMKEIHEAENLAEKMVAIGKANGRNMKAVLSNMNIPLGHAVGNALEIKEVISVLNGKGSSDLTEISLVLASQMLSLALHEPVEIMREQCEKALFDGAALQKFREMVSAQGGDVSYIDHPEKFPTAAFLHEIKAESHGYISHMDTETIGKTATMLGAGREKKGDIIDMTAGIILIKKTGDAVQKGETLAVLHTNRKDKIKDAETMFRNALSCSETQPEREALVYKIL
ncbi:MAG: thymidine phosphorylase [Clostridia bacterium]|nr:thymidine phosphorylase [Clostridia bacterium]